jgi:hypothetical protein
MTLTVKKKRPSFWDGLLDIIVYWTSVLCKELMEIRNGFDPLIVLEVELFVG